MAPVPSTDEMRALMDATAGTPWELPVRIAGTTGMRRQEILDLRWTAQGADCGLSRRREDRHGAANDPYPAHPPAPR